MEANPQAIYRCLLAQWLVKYTDTPLFLEEALYDTWQLSEILQIPCMKNQPKWPKDINECSVEEFVEIHKFKNVTAKALQDAYDQSP